MTRRADPTLLNAALAAADQGQHVFPLRPDAKRPAINDWEHRATIDASRISTCWSSGAYNIGIACGPSRLLVVDLDVPKPAATEPAADGSSALAAMAAAAGQPYPSRTFSVTTPSGGTHLYFTAPGDGTQLRNTAGRLAPLVDTRGHGGYVVAAGSTIGGRRYAAHERPVIDLPPWLRDALRPPEPPPAREATDVVAGVRQHSRYAAAALHAEVDRVQLARPGTRNHALNTAAFSLSRLISNGLLTKDDTTAALHAAATNAGLSDPEITRTIRSGLGAGIHH